MHMCVQLQQCTIGKARERERERERERWGWEMEFLFLQWTVRVRE